MGHRDVNDEGFVSAVEAIYAAAASPAHWPQALQVIAECFDDVGAILIYQRDDGGYGTIASPSLEAASHEYDRDEWWRHDIRFSRSVPLGYFARTDALTDRDIATPAEIETLPFYRQFLRGHGLKWFGAVSISPDPHVAAALSVQRLETKAPFSEAELAIVARLGRHVENALRLGIRLINAETSQEALADVLARLGVGVFLLDAGGRVIFANAAAEQIGDDGLRIVQGRLTAREPSCQEALRVAIGRASVDDAATLTAPPQRVLVPGQEQGGFLAVHILPVRAVPGESVENLLTDVSAIAVVTSAQPGEPADPALVRDLFGLTLAEARIAALIGAGLAPRHASLTLGISEETARTTLKRVFAKIGVSRQSELTALLTKLTLR